MRTNCRIILVLAFFVLPSFGWKTGLKLKSRTERFILTQRLGKGDFSEVWKARDRETRVHHAIKFYRDPRVAEVHVPRVALYVERVGSQNLPNLLKVHGPELLTVEERPAVYVAVLSEVGGRSVQDLAPEEFLLIPDYRNPRNYWSDPNEMGRRVRNVGKLLKDLLAGAEQLFDLRLVHHDINPRNVMRVRRKNKISDFDGVAEHGFDVPPDGSWEYAFGAIEYQDPRDYVEMGEVSDLFTLSSTVYFALFGRSPITEFAQHSDPLVFRTAPNRLIKKARQKIFESHRAAYEFEAMVRDRLRSAQLRNHLPANALNTYTFIADVLEAGLKVSVFERQLALSRVVPHLHQFSYLTPCGMNLLYSDRSESR